MAVVENSTIKAEYFLNNGLTHSQNLMPMVEFALNYFDKPDTIAVTVGPGSFTGVRIAVSCVKGLAMIDEIPCVPVSSMEALAYNFYGSRYKGIICALSDARVQRAYTALFTIGNGKIERLTKDDCLEFAKIDEMLKDYNQDIYLVGDGAKIFAKSNTKYEKNIVDEKNLLTKASSVAFAAINKETISSNELQAVYLQLPQAQRELNNKLKKRDD